MYMSMCIYYRKSVWERKQVNMAKYQQLVNLHKGYVSISFTTQLVFMSEYFQNNKIGKKGH